MFIKELKITRFKSFGSNVAPIVFKTPNGEVGSGLNIFVGENNTGKSTAFEAIDFLRNSTKKNVEDIKNKALNADALVEVVFCSKVNNTIDAFADAKAEALKKYVFNENDVELFKISRCTDDLKLKIWDETHKQYIAVAATEPAIKKLFEANFVWADTNPNDEAAFGSTTICGNLLKEIVKNFTNTDEYQGFKDKFNEVFNADSSNLKQQLSAVEDKVKKIFAEQFGSAQISFHFDELKVDSFFKNVKIEVNDGVNTSMAEKGNGMQRAVALALLQVYADELARHPDDANIEKPFYLFIDEPEICLHPKGQTKLLDALLELSKTKQIFLTTHSPYFLSTPFLKNIGVFVFSAKNNILSIEEASANPLLPWSPTWGEINYKAYNLATVEFHNELYGYLQEREAIYIAKDFDNWLESKGLLKSKDWILEKNGAASTSFKVAMQTFIRHKIHHPENQTMQSHEYSVGELEQSIKEMISLL
jgi:predicted ATP-dependent endonuclease of OLD family